MNTFGNLQQVSRSFFTELLISRQVDKMSFAIESKFQMLYFTTVTFQGF